MTDTDGRPVSIEAFTAMGQGLDAMVEAYERTRADNDGRWLPGSPATLAVQAAAGTPWGEKRITDAYLTNQLLMLSAGDHLRSIGALMPNKTCGHYSLFTLARAGAEAAARVWSIYEPDLVSEERACRAANEILNSLHEQIQAARKARLDDSGLRAKEEEIVSFVDQRGLAVGRPSDRKAGWVGRRRDSFAFLLGQILAIDKTEGDVAGVVHNQLSAIVHGTEQGLFSLLAELTPSGTPGISSARIRLVPGPTAVRLGSAPIAYAAAAQRAIGEFGWDRTRFTDAFVPALLLWRDVAKTTQVDGAPLAR